MAQTNGAEINFRLKAVERLLKLFHLERTVHLAIATVSVVALLGCAFRLMIRDQAGPAEYTLLFGSSGLITFAASRLLVMWNQALRVITMRDVEETP